jgi:hypothetical protein
MDFRELRTERLDTMQETPLDPNLKYSWQQAVLDAFVEFHPGRMREKLDAAERAISGRLLQRPTDSYEVLALRDALSALQILFRENKLKVESTDKKEIK